MIFDEVLARPEFERLRDWVSIGPVQRAVLMDFIDEMTKEIVYVEAKAYTAGCEAGHAEGRTRGYDEGYEDGYDQGRADAESEHDGQPDEAQEWHDFDPEC